MTIWITGEIINNIHWTNELFSLTVRAPIEPFIAGQFTKIKLTINGRNIQRPYSYLNSPTSKNLIFYLVTVPKGKLTHTLYKLQTGDTIKLTKQSYGNFVINKIPQCENLWMIATGTGIAPYLSILTHGKGLEKFTNIILIYAVRFSKHLHYTNIINQLKIKYQNKLTTQTILSQEKSPDTLTGHVQELIANGELEKKIGLQLKNKNSHIMLCGNPNMIYETQTLLKEYYNMNHHSNTHPGHITTERYW
ncbi:ferredoxin--NADP(+) reductase [Blochmannia endosymbiont of Polyrhachis (Hedomyrma) turneri]|uniref:ferredoxin--NADP(+) reductase n=1 Tax=Blochmannia endosymbiont of Polyrhachis (Hedomyrma) turneri TaxID=1505596 RepID=UPI00061A805C|nr:ferredoxin--NADP(+) reductase [Blochmannia endosymbiont of Polyrhachis (Hedomyrma) turneri]AKC60152.1 ferredoxin-NADP reductase [Blochmannia endosymbiont of Polyrhachis (Hedomyrma) turneri]